MYSSTLSNICLSLLAIAVTACGAAPGESTEPGFASSQAALDCRPYHSFTGALGAATIDCLGRVGTFDYQVETSTGVPVLVRGFDSCPNLNASEAKSKLLQIDQLLSIQLPERQHLEQRTRYSREFAQFPDATTCVARAFGDAQQELREEGIAVCPTFKRTFSIGSRSEANVKRVLSLLPTPTLIGNPPKLGFPPGSFGPKSRLPEEYPVYSVSFEQSPPPNQPCGRAEDCAKACSSVFAGFYVARVGRMIVGDPDWWLDSTHRPFTGASPYSKVNGYYHPMAAAGDAPGALYANINRAWDAFWPRPDGEPEECTYWTPDGDLLGRLLNDNPSQSPLSRTAISRCYPY